MGARQAVIDTLFRGNSDPLNNIIVGASGDVTPEAGITAPKGTLFLVVYQGNAADYDVYINENGATTWSLIYDASTYGHPGPD